MALWARCSNRLAGLPGGGGGAAPPLLHRLLAARSYHVPPYEVKVGIPKFLNDWRIQIQRKLILKYTHKYRLGLWRPRAEPRKLQSA